MTPRLRRIGYEGAMRRSTTRLALLTCLTVGLGTATTYLPLPQPVVLADSGEVGLQFFEKQYDGMTKSCAKKLWEVARKASKSNFHQFARETAQRVLDFDPDHKDARELLNYEKQRGEWVVDEDALAGAQLQNTKNVKEPQEAFDKRVEAWREDLAKAQAYVAAKYAQVGEACAKKGYDDQATKAFERALGLDPKNEDALRGLGYEKVGLVWLTPKQQAAIKAALDGKPVDGTSRLEEGLGTKLHKYESPHFRVEDDASPEALPDTVKALETLYAYYLADIGMDPTEDVFDGNKIEFCVLSDQSTWEKWVDQFSNSADKPWTKENNTYRGYLSWVAGVKRVETAEHIDTRDPLLNHAAHFLGHHVWRAKRHAWLDEALAYYYTVKVQGTTRTHSVAKKIGEYADQGTIGGEKDWALSERWKEYLGELVKAENDVELRTIMKSPLETLDLPQTVKAWGVISYLMDERREDFIRFLGALREAGDEGDPVEVFQDVFATSVEAIDRQWRDFAKRAY